MTQLPIQQTFDLAVRHHQARRFQEAEQLYRQVLAQQPGHSAAMHYLGLLAYQAGQNDAAMDLIRRAIALNPSYPEAHNNLGNVLRDTGQTNEAIAAYRQAIALRPNYAEAHSNLGNALKDNGRFEEAIVAYRHAISLNPGLPEVHSNLGAALSGSGQTEEAIAAFRKAIELRPNLAEAYCNLGVALKDRGQLEEAVAAYRQAIALRPNYAEALSNLGIALKERGQLDEAIAAHGQAIAVAPNLPEPYNNLGIALNEQGKFDEAIAAFRQAIVISPNMSEAQKNLVFALYYHPGYDSRSVYRQIVAQIPNHPETMHSLGLLAARFGRPEEAMELFAKAIEANPNQSRYHDSLGSAFTALKRFPEAVASFERAIQLRPEWDDARCRLSAALMRQSALSPSTCRISYVIASRNDAFCGNPMDRLRVVLQRLLDVATDFEVVVADWGSDVPIFDVMKAQLPATGKIRFLRIPPAVTGRFHTPFSEVHALNAAIRRSRGVFVGRIDQDTLIGQRYATWAAHILEDDDSHAYFSIRRDLPPDVCAIQPNAPIWGGYAPVGPEFPGGAVGILLAPRRVWHWTRGYDEKLLFRNHMEHDLCQRFDNLAGLQNLSVIVNCDFYHIWHPRPAGVRHNQQRPMQQIAIEAKRNLRVNDENWGLGDWGEQITEKIL